MSIVVVYTALGAAGSERETFRGQIETARQPSPLPGAAAPLKELGPLGSRHTARSRCSAVPPREAKTAPKGFPLSAVLPQRDRYRDDPAAGGRSTLLLRPHRSSRRLSPCRCLAYRAGAGTRKVAGDRSSVPRVAGAGVGRACVRCREAGVDSLLEYVTIDLEARGRRGAAATQRRANPAKG